MFAVERELHSRDGRIGKRRIERADDLVQSW
jgi:hypothetical protein